MLQLTIVFSRNKGQPELQGPSAGFEPQFGLNGGTPSALITRLSVRSDGASAYAASVAEASSRYMTAGQYGKHCPSGPR